LAIDIYPRGAKIRLQMKRYVFALIIIPLFAGQLFAQTAHMEHDMPGMVSMEMAGMYGPYAISREASGTSWQPDTSPASGINLMRKDWSLMMHGFINAIYDHQGGKRGDDKAFSSSMFMFMAQKQLSTGTFGFRSMLSLDPLMGKKGYPLLLQTGETADGKSPLIDRQHPHDLFMELACSYSYNLSENSSAFLYFGLPGEPALGPPAFMHRVSGGDFPDAPIMHHWLDSTHITFGVLTSGFVWKDIKIDGSVFRGREPDQSRWDIEPPKLDSYSGRLTFNPLKNFSMQASYGFLDSPEQLEPDVDTRRITASISYNLPYKEGNWQTTFCWGQNKNSPGRSLKGFLLESELAVKNKHTILMRFERVDKDELFLDDEPFFGSKFTLNKLSLGYIYDFRIFDKIKFGIGSSLGAHFLPSELKASYGRLPLSCMIFARLKLD
jgi:hypothetical protein